MDEPSSATHFLRRLSNNQRLRLILCFGYQVSPNISSYQGKAHSHRSTTMHCTGTPNLWVHGRHAASASCQEKLPWFSSFRLFLRIFPEAFHEHSSSHQHLFEHPPFWQARVACRCHRHDRWRHARSSECVRRRPWLFGWQLRRCHGFERHRDRQWRCHQLHAGIGREQRRHRQWLAGDQRGR